MKPIAAELTGPVCSAEPDPAATSRLLAMYHRSVGRRLAVRSGVASTPRFEDLLRAVRRLPPEVVRLAYSGPPDGSELHFPYDAAAAAAHPDGMALYRVRDEPAWARAGARDVLRSLGWDEPDAGRVVAPPRAVEMAYSLARDALTAAWPELAAELELLVARLVVLEGPVRSATVQSSFGAIWAEATHAADPLRMYELLLHEGGHHALALREQFATFLHNPDDLGRHAFRKDPRPLRGVLHAAFVMHRIRSGLQRYRSRFDPGGPMPHQMVDERIAFASDAGRAALELLDKKARWTADGEKLRAALHPKVMSE